MLPPISTSLVSVGFAALAATVPTLSNGGGDVCPAVSTVYVTISPAPTIISVPPSFVSADLSPVDSTMTIHSSIQRTVIVHASADSSADRLNQPSASYDATITETAVGVVTDVSVIPASGETVSYTETAAPNGLLSFIVQNGTTYWLNGQTPDPTQSLVVVTSSVEVVPYPTPAITDGTKTLTKTVKSTQYLTLTETAAPKSTSHSNPISPTSESDFESGVGTSPAASYSNTRAGYSTDMGPGAWDGTSTSSSSLLIDTVTDFVTAEYSTVMLTVTDIVGTEIGSTSLLSPTLYVHSGSSQTLSKPQASGVSTADTSSSTCTDPPYGNSTNVSATASRTNSASRMSTGTSNSTSTRVASHLNSSSGILTTNPTDPANVNSSSVTVMPFFTNSSSASPTATSKSDRMTSASAFYNVTTTSLNSVSGTIRSTSNNASAATTISGFPSGLVSLTRNSTDPTISISGFVPTSASSGVRFQNSTSFTSGAITSSVNNASAATITSGFPSGLVTSTGNSTDPTISISGFVPTSSSSGVPFQNSTSSTSGVITSTVNNTAAPTVTSGFSSGLVISTGNSTDHTSSISGGIPISASSSGIFQNNSITSAGQSSVSSVSGAVATPASSSGLFQNTTIASADQSSVNSVSGAVATSASSSGVLSADPSFVSSVSGVVASPVSSSGLFQNTPIVPAGPSIVSSVSGAVVVANPTRAGSETSFVSTALGGLTSSVSGDGMQNFTNSVPVVASSVDPTTSGSFSPVFTTSNATNSSSSTSAASSEFISSNVDFTLTISTGAGLTSLTKPLTLTTSTYHTTTTSRPLSTVASASVTPSSCGVSGDFVLNFDDIPPLSVKNQSFNDIQPAPVFNPYHQFLFSDGFVVVPPPTDPYLPSSGKLLTEFIPNFNVNGSNTQAGPNTDEYGTSGAITDGDRGLTGCFRFNFYGASLGCDSKGPDCDFTFTGYKYDNVTRITSTVTQQIIAVPACPSLNVCSLDFVTVDSDFTDLTQININVTVAGESKIWWMDDVRMGWTDNACATGLCRLSAHIR